MSCYRYDIDPYGLIDGSKSRAWQGTMVLIISHYKLKFDGYNIFMINLLPHESLQNFAHVSFIVITLLQFELEQN